MVKNENGNKFILKEVHINEGFPNFMKYLKQQKASSTRNKLMKNQFVQSVYVSSLITHQDFSNGHIYNRDLAQSVMNEIGKSMPFVLFTMQKKWQKAFRRNRNNSKTIIMSRIYNFKAVDLGLQNFTYLSILSD